MYTNAAVKGLIIKYSKNKTEKHDYKAFNNSSVKVYMEFIRK